MIKDEGANVEGQREEKRLSCILERSPNPHRVDAADRVCVICDALTSAWMCMSARSIV